MGEKLTLPEAGIADLCGRHHILRLSLFGSVLRDDFAPDSDVDILVEFEEDARVGFITMAGIERELGDLIGRRVDLRTPEELSRYFREDVVRNAKVQYAKG